MSPYRTPAIISEAIGPRWGVTPWRRLRYHWARFLWTSALGGDDTMWKVKRSVERLERRHVQMRLALKLETKKLDVLVRAISGQRQGDPK